MGVVQMTTCQPGTLPPHFKELSPPPYKNPTSIYSQIPHLPNHLPPRVSSSCWPRFIPSILQFHGYIYNHPDHDLSKVTAGLVLKRTHINVLTS